MFFLPPSASSTPLRVSLVDLSHWVCDMRVCLPLVASVSSSFWFVSGSLTRRPYGLGEQLDRMQLLHLDRRVVGVGSIRFQEQRRETATPKLNGVNITGNKPAHYYCYRLLFSLSPPPHSLSKLLSLQCISSSSLGVRHHASQCNAIRFRDEMTDIRNILRERSPEHQSQRHIVYNPFLTSM